MKGEIPYLYGPTEPGLDSDLELNLTARYSLPPDLTIVLFTPTERGKCFCIART